MLIVKRVETSLKLKECSNKSTILAIDCIKDMNSSFCRKATCIKNDSNIVVYAADETDTHFYYDCEASNRKKVKYGARKKNYNIKNKIYEFKEFNISQL